MHVVRAARLDAGLTLQQVSDRTGVPLSTIADWETGAHVPRVSTAVKICDELGVSIADILHEYAVKRGKETIA
jgi:transcriptional regulator with XRE-family HTH domain